jgi:hypothetical protein
VSPGTWHDDWQAAGALPDEPTVLVREFRRERRRLALAGLAELAVLAGLLSLGGFALLRSPQISDTLWAAGVLVFLTLVAGAILISRRSPRPASTHSSTREFLAAHEVASRRQLLVLRIAWAALVIGTLALLPFAAWRYRVDTISLTSHHGAFSAIATAVLLVVAASWIRLSQRRARALLDSIRTTIAEAEPPPD